MGECQSEQSSPEKSVERTDHEQHGKTVAD